MSLLRQPFQLFVSNPTSIAVAGAATLAGLPFAQQAAVAAGTGGLTALAAVNLAAYGINLAAVSVPGRLDGAQDTAMRGGDLNPSNNESTPLTTTATTQSPASTDIYTAARNKALVTPAGWAFTICK